MRALTLILCLWFAAPCEPAWAWSRQGHMISAAIAYDELRQQQPRVLNRIMQIMSKHPDRAAFELAVDGVAQDARALHVLMEMARWPDDIRGGAYDHPTWHYASRPLVDTRRPPATLPQDAVAGLAIEAFALNAATAADARAPASERAVALCWIFHLAGDIHQPLHAADGFSSSHPQGDRGGNLQFVKHPQTGQPVTLHWYWDDAVQYSATAGAALQRARELRKKLPRTAFTEIAPAGQPAEDFKAWAAESHALARTHVYGENLTSSDSEKTAPTLAAAYITDSTAVAEQRLTLAGYRLADLLAALLEE